MDELKVAWENFLEDKEEVQFLDAITASSSDAVTNRINSNVYGNDDYELYVKCLIKFGNLAIEVRDARSKVRDIAQETSVRATERAFRFMKAGN